MNTKNILTGLILILLIGSVSAVLRHALVTKDPVTVTAAPELPADPTLVTREFAEKVITRCQAKLSDTKRAILTEQIVRVVRQRFDNEENRQAFMSLLCIESKFSQAAKSPVGATGIAQLMPKYSADFARLCGYQTLDEGDILDTEVNLHLGACYFNSLVTSSGNVFLGMAGYNGGGSGATVKNLKALKGGGPQETADYVNKIAVLREEIKNEKTNYVMRSTVNK